MAPSHGRESRSTRLREAYGGSWGSSSQDLVRLARLLHSASSRYAEASTGRDSPYTLAGIPVLFSALRCVLTELNGGLWAPLPTDSTIRDALATSANDVVVLREYYKLPSTLLRDLDLLIEVRHEIVHPAHRPGPERDNTPDYLRSLRDANLLNVRDAGEGPIWLDQLQSHPLFTWAFQTIRETVAVLLRAHNVHPSTAEAILMCYRF